MEKRLLWLKLLMVRCKRHIQEGIDYDYDHPGIEHSSGISAKQTKPTNNSTNTMDADTVEDSSDHHYPQRDRRPPERLTY